LQQLIIAMSGSFDVVLDDGYQKQRFHLNRSYTAHRHDLSFSRSSKTLRQLLIF
jgi:hypothetical protein